jgi:hypothetical protein
MTVDEMWPVHHIVMYWAIDGGDLRSASAGLVEGIASGEYFVIFEPQPLDAVREATGELVDGGYVTLHHLVPRQPGDGSAADWEEYAAEDALRVVRDPATWDGEEYFELGATDDGIRLWKELDERFGAAARRATDVARQRSDEFRRRHPDFDERQKRYFEDVHLWVETGEGDRPTFPSYPGEPPPYDDEVPRYNKPE